jgi:hypothetical protein
MTTLPDTVLVGSGSHLCSCRAGAEAGSFGVLSNQVLSRLMRPDKMIEL